MTLMLTSLLGLFELI